MIQILVHYHLNSWMQRPTHWNIPQKLHDFIIFACLRWWSKIRWDLFGQNPRLRYTKYMIRVLLLLNAVYFSQCTIRSDLMRGQSDVCNNMMSQSIGLVSAGVTWPRLAGEGSNTQQTSIISLRYLWIINQ